MLGGVGALATGLHTGIASSRILPASMVPLIGRGYRPVDADEKGLWQQVERVEEEIAGSNILIQDPQVTNYLRALCYYEQIADVQRDQKGTEQALLAMKDVVNRFPESAYARDASLKIDLARDHLAGKEMEIGRWYERQHLYAASIGRYQNVVDNYQTTNHVQEALYRLTEIYLKLGLADQARKTASVLGYNYPGSEWYQNGYDALLDNRLVTETSPRRQLGAQQAPTAGDTDNPPPPPGFFSRAWHAVF